MKKFYLVFGIVLLTLFALVQYFGYSFDDTHEEKGIPKNVRENPGSYRSHYHRHYGGYSGRSTIFGGK